LNLSKQTSGNNSHLPLAETLQILPLYVALYHSNPVTGGITGPPCSWLI
jgi:hypothetical protein